MLFVPACGTLEITVLGTPTPDMSAISTIAALQAQNAALATQIASLNSTPTPAAVTTTPSLQPTGTAQPVIVPIMAATRITFLNGATVGMVDAPIEGGRSQNYVLKALKGQPMFVYVASPHNDVTVSIKAQTGADILSAAADQNSWQGSLPQTQDYYLTIHGGVSTENFSLAVTVPSRIQFVAGATSATVGGNTVSGYGVSYVVFAGRGQTMKVDLGNLSDKASLSIFGFTDGQNYLRSEKGQTSYQFVLPSTQDYIIVVVPPSGSEVGFAMKVTIK
jgi:hypothetical protein